jgi:ATP-dependent DNA helicase RecQ
MGTEIRYPSKTGRSSDKEKKEEEDPVSTLAKESFGIDYLFPLQRMAIANILDASMYDWTFRQLVLFPTGFGKSLCFQLPSLLCPGITVVVYPLLALMNDQKRSLDGRNIPSSLFRGGMDESERQKEFAALRNGRSRIVITNPETLVRPSLRRFLMDAGVFHLAIDEAHCVSEWGETFRPSYLELGACIKDINPKVVSAFTATASPEVAAAVTRHIFGSEGFSLVTADMDKANLRYSITPTMTPFHSLSRLVCSMEKPILIFDQSRAGVRQICEALRERTGIQALFYHAGLSREEKKAVEEWFMNSADGVLAATCAYGMGVDKRNIRTVIHFSPPPSVEAYIQEAGRAGRDGNVANAILIDRWDTRRVGAKEGSGAAIQAPLSMQATQREQRKMNFLALLGTKGCRREALHELMGCSLDSPCSGCDVCDNRIQSMPDGFEEMLEFFTVNRWRFSPRAAAFRLCMSGFLEGSGALSLCRAAGSLRGWREEDVLSLIQQSVRLGYLSLGGGWTKKGRVGMPVKSPDESNSRGLRLKCSIFHRMM